MRQKIHETSSSEQGDQGGELGVKHHQVQHRAEGSAGSQGSVTSQGWRMKQRRMIIMRRNHKMLNSYFVMEIMMRLVMENFMMGWMMFKMSHLMMNFIVRFMMMMNKWLMITAVMMMNLVNLQRSRSRMVIRIMDNWSRMMIRIMNNWLVNKRNMKMRFMHYWMNTFMMMMMKRLWSMMKWLSKMMKWWMERVW